MYRLIFEDDRAILEVSENMSVADLKKLHSKLSKGIEIKKVDTISDEQMKILWCIFKDLGDLIGYSREEMRIELQNEYCSSKKIEHFSISPYKKDRASKEVATDFISWIIDWSIHEGYNLILHIGKGSNRKLKSAREVCPDIRRMTIARLRTKTCVICGRNADLHHEPPLGTNYDLDDGLQTGFIPLCREHHTERHNTSWDSFSKKWHLESVWLNPTMVSELKKIYKNHFKAFNVEDYKQEGYHGM